MHKNYDGEMLLYPGPIFQYSINIYRCEAGWLAKWLDGCLAGWLVGWCDSTNARARCKQTHISLQYVDVRIVRDIIHRSYKLQINASDQVIPK